MKCKNCNNVLPEEAKFCEKCDVKSGSDELKINVPTAIAVVAVVILFIFIYTSHSNDKKIEAGNPTNTSDYVIVDKKAVLEGFNEAKAKGEDASTKASLSNMRAEAELYWDSVSTNGKDGYYIGVCADAESIKILSQSFRVGNESYVCNDSYAAYAISAPLHSGKYFCVDSTNNDPHEIGSNISKDITQCPAY